tara:strand:- start:246 stop:428 length:183 start_codon:yes stop_codon:yes gene_type:complete
MVEPISISALVLAIITGIGFMAEKIIIAVSNSNCVTVETVSSSGSTRKIRKFGSDEEIPL